MLRILTFKSFLKRSGEYRRLKKLFYKDREYSYSFEDFLRKEKRSENAVLYIIVFKDKDINRYSKLNERWNIILEGIKNGK